MSNNCAPNYTKTSLPHSYSFDANILQVLQNCPCSSKCCLYCPQCQSTNQASVNCYCEKDNVSVTKSENQRKHICNMNEFSGLHNNAINRLQTPDCDAEQLWSNYNSWMRTKYNRELSLIQELREITLVRQDLDCRFGIRMEKCNHVSSKQMFIN